MTDERGVSDAQLLCDYEDRLWRGVLSQPRTPRKRGVDRDLRHEQPCGEPVRDVLLRAPAVRLVILQLVEARAVTEHVMADFVGTREAAPTRRTLNVQDDDGLWIRCVHALETR